MTATTDVFVHDRETGTTHRVSVGSDGGQADADSVRPWICADGHRAVFMSKASNLASGSTSGGWGVFVHEIAWPDASQ
jgi:hypothetical protein